MPALWNPRPLSPCISLGFFSFIQMNARQRPCHQPRNSIRRHAPGHGIQLRCALVTIAQRNSTQHAAACPRNVLSRHMLCVQLPSRRRGHLSWIDACRRALERRAMYRRRRFARPGAPSNGTGARGQRLGAVRVQARWGASNGARALLQTVRARDSRRRSLSRIHTHTLDVRFWRKPSPIASFPA